VEVISGLKGWISKVIHANISLIVKGIIQKVAVIISNKEGIPVESFTIELDFIENPKQTTPEEMELGLRAFLLKLNMCDSSLQPLTKGMLFISLLNHKRLYLQHSGPH
jgi:hypothetical protein